MPAKAIDRRVSFGNRGFSTQIILIVLACALLIGGIVGFFFLKPFSSSKQNVYHIGVLAALELFYGTTDGFKEKMTELGYIEGENIFYDIQKPAAPVGNESIAQKFVADKVDLIFSYPTEASLESKKVTQGTSIPVVFANSSLDGVSLVDSVRKPGGNISGVQFPTTDTAVQRLEILHEMAPNAKRMLVPYLKGYPIVPLQIERLRLASEPLGITIIELPAANPEDVTADLESREQASDIGVDAILIIPEPLTINPSVYPLLNSFAARHKLVMGGALAEFPESSSLFSYIPDSVEVGKQAAVIADKVLKGTSAGTIPVVSSENNLTINYKLAQTMGISVSEALLSRAKTILK